MEAIECTIILPTRKITLIFPKYSHRTKAVQNMSRFSDHFKKKKQFDVGGWPLFCQKQIDLFCETFHDIYTVQADKYLL